MNRFPLLGKLLTIAALTAVLLVALAAVRGIVNERSGYRQQAQAEVAAAHAGPQTVVGPVLWLPYTETLVRTVKEDTEAGPRQRQ